MKWYHESIECKEQPGNVIMSLIGRYNDDPTKHMITIELVIDEHAEGDYRVNRSTQRSYVTLFEKSPSSLRTENPSAGDIFNKYRGNIMKIRTKVANTEYSELIRKKQN